MRNSECPNTELRQIQRATDGNSQRPGDALDVILLDAGDGFGNEIRHDAVDRAAIVTAIPQHSLERSDVGRVAQQLVARFEVVIQARAGAMLVIGRVDIRHLMQHAPFIPGRERICGMKKRMVVLSERGGCEKNAKENEGAAKKSSDAHVYVRIDQES
jgi:hypothetical protein